MPDLDAGWRFVSIGFEHDPTYVCGVDLWKATWVATGDRVTVAHPSYPAQRHTMFTYEVAGTQPPVVFAAGEFSNGVWGFFVPDDDRTPETPRSWQSPAALQARPSVDDRHGGPLKRPG